MYLISIYLRLSHPHAARNHRASARQQHDRRACGLDFACMCLMRMKFSGDIRMADTYTLQGKRIESEPTAASAPKPWE